MRHLFVVFKECITETLAISAITGLVAFRIWWLNRSIMAFLGHSYYPVMFLVLESGAVYSATLTALLILYKTGSWFQYVLLDAVCRQNSRCSRWHSLTEFYPLVAPH